MKKILLIVLFALPLWAASQKLPYTGFDKVRLTQSDKIIHAVTAAENPAKKLSPALNYYWYRSNEIHITQGGFSGKVLDGPYIEYFLNKALKEQGSFKKGLKDGVWKTWNEGGVLLTIYTWKTGKLNGPFTIFEDGKTESSGNYKNGLLNGTVTNYLPGDSLESSVYLNGKVVPQVKDTVSRWRKLIPFRKKGTKRDTIKNNQ